MYALLIKLVYILCTYINVPNMYQIGEQLMDIICMHFYGSILYIRVTRDGIRRTEAREGAKSSGKKKEKMPEKQG